MKSLKSTRTTLQLDSFWECVYILIRKPHVINKRLWGCKIWFKYYCKFNDPLRSIPVACNHLEDIVTEENIQKHASNIFENLCLAKTSDANDFEIMLIELFPKNYADKHAYQLALLKNDKTMVSFFNVTPQNYTQILCPNFSYSLRWDCDEIQLTAFDDGKSKSYLWLCNNLLPQFVKWGIGSETLKPSICTESLQLVSKTLYYYKYNNLKIKYGKELVKIWPECTDPAKFVYEDVAIAAYLLLLWEKDSNTKKTFVDLGCGNGLLVYILTREGHSGIGIDVRKRNIWDMYPADVILQERTITPSDNSLFPNVDYIIGNHSDELTPWIPVIAANCSFECNFFLLPCCAYNFDGSKYQRKNSFKSQYMDYLDYIKHLCEDCGFNFNIDRLKIPSTKRICLVSNGRNYFKKEYEKYCEKINNLVNFNSNISQEFKAREQVELVRNCTQVDRNVVNEIVTYVTSFLLKDCQNIDIQWSIGNSAEINKLIPLIPKDLLQKLKLECGGLQTLLKNNHHIFKVHSGIVELRYPKTVEEAHINNKKNKKLKQNAIKIQQRPCWFYGNHPQGCPLSKNDCSFLHVSSL